MTTVDVRITGPAGSGTLYLHCGLFGPAATALHALIREFVAGTLTGPWHSSFIETKAPGSVVRSILSGIDDADREFSDEDRGRFIAFRAAVKDNAEYAIHAIEV